MSALLELRAVDAYYGKSHALFGLSMEVRKGEVVALLGRNGSGRSTTLKAVMGLVAVRGGSIALAGAGITAKAPFVLARMGIAYVPEERRIFPNLTVAENLRLAALTGRKGPWTEQRVYETFEVLGKRRNSPAKLSGGEQQMLAIARALIANPSIILLDEPMEGLAPMVARSVEDVVRRIKEDGNTILLVEQNANVAMSLADRAYVLSQGKLVAEGSSAALRADAAAMHRYLAV